MICWTPDGLMPMRLRIGRNGSIETATMRWKISSAGIDYRDDLRRRQLHPHFGTEALPAHSATKAGTEESVGGAHLNSGIQVCAPLSAPLSAQSCYGGDVTICL